MNSHARIGMLVAVAACWCWLGCNGSTNTVRTSNHNAEWHADFFKRHLEMLQPHGSGVLIGGAQFLIGSPAPQTVLAGHTFIRQDDHGRVVYTLSDITVQGVVMGYRSSFAHHSFGKNVIEVDEGTFELPWVTPHREQTDRR